MSGERPAAVPDVLALPLEDAQRELEAAGFVVEVRETHPPRGAGRGPRRVVQQRREGDRVRLVVTHERYERPAPPAGAGR